MRQLAKILAALLFLHGTASAGYIGNGPFTMQGLGTAGSSAGGVVSVQGVSGGTPVPFGLNTTPSLANGNGIVPTQGGSVLSATNGSYQNILQGNAVLSISNPLFITGTGTAGTAATNPITVQGIASMTPLLVNPGTAANWGVGATGSAVPANGFYNTINIGGTLRGWTGVNPSGTVYAGQVDLASIAGTLTVTGGVSGSLGIGGLAASGGSIAGNPLLNGGRAENAEPTPVSNGQAVAAAYGLEGKAIILPYANKENMVRGAASATGTGATTIIAAAGSGIKNYIVAAQCYRNDAGTAAITVTFNDSASTEIVLPNGGGGGGSNATFPVPLATAANTAFQFTAGTSTSTVFCNAQGYTGS